MTEEEIAKLVPAELRYRCFVHTSQLGQAVVCREQDSRGMCVRVEELAKALKRNAELTACSDAAADAIVRRFGTQQDALDKANKRIAELTECRTTAVGLCPACDLKNHVGAQCHYDALKQRNEARARITELESKLSNLRIVNAAAIRERDEARAEVERLARRIIELEEECAETQDNLARAVDALGFYADETTHDERYRDHDVGCHPDGGCVDRCGEELTAYEWDAGMRARRALAEIEKDSSAPSARVTDRAAGLAAGIGLRGGEPAVCPKLDDGRERPAQIEKGQGE